MIYSKLTKKVIALRDSGGMVPEDFLQVSVSKVQHLNVTDARIYLGFIKNIIALTRFNLEVLFVIYMLEFQPKTTTVSGSCSGVVQMGS